MEMKTKELIASQVAEVELIFKTRVKSSERIAIRDSKDCYQVFKEIWDKGKISLVEEFKVLFLNRANKIVGFLEVSSGGITGTVADPRIILVTALKILAVNIVLAHNHPSGNLKPSRADEELTRKIKGACGYFDIMLLDHIILTDESYFSFADEGIL
ncbi:MAG: DNA repair protein [Bacteroidetes bacterium]|nr:MAG: DNA repair protein [Bacteroidota bacterium]